MTVSAREPAVAVGSPEPVCLAVAPDPVLAFLHEPTGEQRDTAVLVCPPFGWDENSSYRPRRRWAQALASAGYPVARIDLPSTGDSGGAPEDPDRLGAWTGAVASTADWLRERTGCPRVAVIGIGLGGLVSYVAAAEGAAIDDFVLWAVPSSGRVLLRELKAYGGVIAARHPADARGAPPLPGGAAEQIGFMLSGETIERLGHTRLDDLELPTRPGRRALVLSRDGLASDTRVRARLEQCGVAVTMRDTGDYGELMAHPQEAQIPTRTIAETIEWLHEGSAPLAGGHGTRSGLERESLELQHDGAPIRETPVTFALSDGGMTFGMLTEPVGEHRSPLCAVLLNGGALRHTGPNRAWVEIARRWAAQGVASVRVDLAGIGDAEGDERQFVSNPKLYAERSNLDTLAVLAQLAERGLGERFVLVGLCSGAYWALHAALRDARVAGALMINLYSFYWSERLVFERETAESIGALRQQGWRRLVRRDVSADRLLTAVKSIRPSRIRRGARHQVEASQRDQIERDLDRLRDQGTETLLLLSHGEPLYDQLARQGQLEAFGRWPNAKIERIPSRDHMFRAIWLQEYVHAELDRALKRIRARIE
jgi:pimeloyl-ACP methyl ester carboxylesterase